MAEKDAKLTDRPLTLSDDQIVTERVFPRRSFVTSTGAFLIGAGALVFGVRAQAQASDPDQKKSDPDQKRSDP
ncbi:MAG: hypothetical protein ACRD22_14895, partial [Terriglobia bacterium]